MTLNTCSDHESIHFYHAVHRLSTFWIMKQSEIHMRFRILPFSVTITVRNVIQCSKEYTKYMYVHMLKIYSYLLLER